MNITELKGIGPQLASKLARLGIHSTEDALFHLPIRYQDRTRITPIGALQLHDEVVIEGEVRAADIVFSKRRSLVCRLQDGSGTITLRFFHFSMAQKNQLKTGIRLRCFGEVRRGRSGLELYHPEYSLLQENTAADPLEKLALENCLTPIYPLTDGLTQPRLRSVIAQALQLLHKQTLADLLPLALFPPELVASENSLVDILTWLHHPPRQADLRALQQGRHIFQQRLAFEELVAHHLSLLQLRERLQQRTALALPANADVINKFLATLPFSLTQAQQRVFAEISHDLARPQPMLRLVQGDVGCGKTLVAALAALQAIQHGKQVALMAPTELLAEQHLRNFRQWFTTSNIRIGWLTGSLKSKERAGQLQALANGETQLVIGTHALFQDEVLYHNLALVMIDEQHRFGVHQRLALSDKARASGYEAHQLTMTATPIPRTLAMSVYADLDCSVIDELPPGRTPVNTVLIDNARREPVIERVRLACQSGRQAYWVCTLIEESEELECEAAETTATNLAQALPGLRIGLVHGRLKTAEKNRVMDAFKRGELDLLVATTVIEVGVDVPNASLMIIENPERLGLAQLHQLRGRVGRGSAESHCVLLYSSPLGTDSKERLAVMRETHDGFVIAEKDLQLRGPGEVLGTRQTGAIDFHIADLQRDAHLLTDVKRAALELRKQLPQQVPALIERWLGKNERYGRA